MQVFINSLISNYLDPIQIEALKTDFINYKVFDITPNYFGKDVGYDHPNTPSVLLQECVMHLHLNFNEWKPSVQPFKRTSDTHLIYCQGAMDPDAYLLITILDPDAHDQIKKFSIWCEIGEIAEQFRMQY